MNNSEEAAPQHAAGAQPTRAPATAGSEDGIDSIWDRIKRHKVFEWALAYVAFGYAALHGSEMLREALEWPTAVPRLTLFALLLGFPFAITLSWYHGHRAHHRISRIEIGILAVLLLMAGTILWFLSRYPRTTAPPVAATVPGTAATSVFTPPPHSIAVLPFVNMSGDATQEYFSDGITEELLNALSRLNDLQVTARTSSFFFKGKDVDISTIAHKLNVGAVLEGSVRRNANTVRITVQLIDAMNGFHLWSQTYDQQLTDILKVQTDVATSVARELEVKLAGDEANKVELGGTKNSEAYDAFLRAMQLFNKVPRHESEYRTIVKEFDLAISLDPNYALALAWRANALVNLWERVKDPQLQRDALTSARRAVALAPELGEAHLDLAYTIRSMLDMAGAAPEFERALALAPGSAKVQSIYGQFEAELGGDAPAMTAALRSLSLDPQGIWTRKVWLDVLLGTRHFTDIPTEVRHAQALDPSLANLLEWYWIESQLASAHFELARQTCESSATPLDEDDRHYCLALAYHALKRAPEAEREFERMRLLDGSAAYCDYAGVYAQWGDKLAAMRSLMQAERARSICLISVKKDWRLDPLRNEPEFKHLLTRMNFPP